MDVERVALLIRDTAKTGWKSHGRQTSKSAILALEQWALTHRHGYSQSHCLYWECCHLGGEDWRGLWVKGGDSWLWLHPSEDRWKQGEPEEGEGATKRWRCDLSSCRQKAPSIQVQCWPRDWAPSVRSYQVPWPEDTQLCPHKKMPSQLWTVQVPCFLGIHSSLSPQPKPEKSKAKKISELHVL